jgi:apolipoprotein D and lipocalin family protein
MIKKYVKSLTTMVLYCALFFSCTKQNSAIDTTDNNADVTEVSTESLSQLPIGFGEVTAVENVDFKRYLGKWYQVAAIVAPFLRGCNCTSATYTPKNADTINVLNKCTIDSTGRENIATGVAYPAVPGSTSGKLKVKFNFPPNLPAGDYWILDLADDYSYAVVGDPRRQTLFFLSRTPVLPVSKFSRSLIKVARMGFDVKKVEISPRCTTQY